MPTYRRVKGVLKLALCLLLCVGATLDDIDYVNALRVRIGSLNRGNPVVDDDSDDQHGHQLIAAKTADPFLGVPFLCVFWAIQLKIASPDRPAPRTVRSARAPPVAAA